MKKKRELPPPRIVALLCSSRSWDDDIDEDTRKILEMSHKTILLLLRRLIVQAHDLEYGEARR